MYRGLGCCCTVVHSMSERAPASERAVCIEILLAGYEAAELPPACLGTRKYISLSDVSGRDSHMVVAMVARAYSYLQMNCFDQRSAPRLDRTTCHRKQRTMCCVEMEQHREMEPHRCALSQTRAAAEVGCTGCNFTTAGSDRANAGREDRQAESRERQHHHCTPSG